MSTADMACASPTVTAPHPPNCSAKSSKLFRKSIDVARTFMLSTHRKLISTMDALAPPPDVSWVQEGKPMPVRRCSLLLVFALVAFSTPTGVSAQTVNGAIISVVKDSSGAVVPDVAVTLRNIARDEMVGTTVTDADGNYAFR